MTRTRLVPAVGALVAAVGLVAGLTGAAATQDAKPAANPSAPAAAQPPESAASPLDAVAPYVGGEWRFDGKWVAGNPLKAREVFTWGVGRKFVVCKTFVANEDGTEYQRYEAVFGVKDEKLMSWNFVFDGSSDAAEFTVQGRKLVSAKPMHVADGQPPATLHQSIELVGPDKFHWLVSIEQDGKMQPLMDGYWTRAADGAAAAR